MCVTICNDPEQCRESIRYAKRYYPGWITKEDIRYNVGENLWSNPEERVDNTVVSLLLWNNCKCVCAHMHAVYFISIVMTFFFIFMAVLFCIPMLVEYFISFCCLLVFCRPYFCVRKKERMFCCCSSFWRWKRTVSPSCVLVMQTV